MQQQLLEVSSADFIKFVGENLVMGLLAIVGVLGRRFFKQQEDKNKEYDAHLKACNVKAVDMATFVGQVKTEHATTIVHIENLSDRCGRIETTITTIDGKLDRLLER